MQIFKVIAAGALIYLIQDLELRRQLRASSAQSAGLALRCLWPGGIMYGFILWMAERWREWFNVIGGKPQIIFPAHQREFDQWLFASVGLVNAA